MSVTVYFKFRNFISYILYNFQIPIDCFEEPWVIFRGKDGQPGCVQNTCAHRACPLHLGSVNEGRIQCPYHGIVYYLYPCDLNCIR
jgi:chlorophyllide a oxygenase